MRGDGQTSGSNSVSPAEKRKRQRCLRGAFGSKGVGLCFWEQDALDIPNTTAEVSKLEESTFGHGIRITSAVVCSHGIKTAY